MVGLFLNDLVFVLPEVYLILTLLTVLPLGVVFDQRSRSVGHSLGAQLSLLVSVLLIFLGLIYLNIWEIEVSIFSNMFERSHLRHFFLLIVLVGSLFVVRLGHFYTAKSNLQEWELFSLLLFVVLGSICLIFCNDFLGFYLGLELQGLCLYILATLKVNSTFSTEAGLKYFVLGAFASSLILFGMSLLYGFSGISNFGDLNLLFLDGGLTDLPLQLGCVSALLFIFMGLIFKVGGAPFHVWVPDVYEGVPSYIMAFFAVVPKVGVFCVLLNLSQLTLVTSTHWVSDLMLYAGVLSILVGSVGALVQANMKRLIAYSAVGHGGFVLLALSFGSVEGVASVMLYVGIYVSLLLSMLSVILSTVQRNNSSVILFISNLRFIRKSHPVLALSLCFAVFGIAGIPPLSGFFSKLLVFFAAIKSEYLLVAIVCIGASVVSSAYYLRIVRGLMFLRNYKSWLFFFDVSRLSAYLIVLTFFANIFFVFWGEWFLALCYNLSLFV